MPISHVKVSFLANSDTAVFNTITFSGEILAESSRQEMRLPELERPCMTGGEKISSENDKTLPVCAHANITDVTIDSWSTQLTRYRLALNVANRTTTVFAGIKKNITSTKKGLRRT